MLSTQEVFVETDDTTGDSGTDPFSTNQTFSELTPSRLPLQPAILDFFCTRRMFATDNSELGFNSQLPAQDR